MRRRAATSALGRSAAVRERLLLRWSAEQSSTAAELGDDHVDLVTFSWISVTYSVPWSQSAPGSLVKPVRGGAD